MLTERGLIDLGLSLMGSAIDGDFDAVQARIDALDTGDLTEVLTFVVALTGHLGVTVAGVRAAVHGQNELDIRLLIHDLHDELMRELEEDR